MSRHLPAITNQSIEKAGNQLKKGRPEGAIPVFRQCFISLQIPSSSTDPKQSLAVRHILQVLSHISTCPGKAYIGLSENLRDLWPNIWEWISYLIEIFEFPIHTRRNRIETRLVAEHVSALIFIFSRHQGFRRDMLDTPGLLPMIIDKWADKISPFERVFYAIVHEDSTDDLRRHLLPLLDGKISRVARAAVYHLRDIMTNHSINFEFLSMSIHNVKVLLDLCVPDVYHALCSQGLISVMVDLLALFKPSDMDHHVSLQCLWRCLDIFGSLLFTEHAVEFLEEALPCGLLQSSFRIGSWNVSEPGTATIIGGILELIFNFTVYPSVLVGLWPVINEIGDDGSGTRVPESLRAQFQILDGTIYQRSKVYLDYLDDNLSTEILQEGCIRCTKPDGRWHCSGCREENCFVRYCSRKCQKLDWPIHRKICRSRIAVQEPKVKSAPSREDREFVWYLAQRDWLQTLETLVSYVHSLDPYVCSQPLRIGIEYDKNRTCKRILESREYCIRCRNEPYLLTLQIKISGGLRPNFIYGSIPLPESFKRREPASDLVSVKFLCTKHRGTDFQFVW